MSGAIAFAILLGIVAVAMVAKVLVLDTMDPDCFWHLRVADRILERGAIVPLVDTLAFDSMKTPWTPYSWLAELAMRRVWNAGGYQAAVAAAAAIQAAFVIFLGLSALEATIAFTGQPRYLAAALGAAMGAYVSGSYLGFRPVTAALLILAICAWLILRDRRMRQRSLAVWMVPLLVAVCINLHFFAMMVPLWIAALWLGDAIETIGGNPRRMIRQTFLLIACAVACTATPLLRGTLQTVYQYAAHDVMVQSNIIKEIQPFYWGIDGIASAVLVGVLWTLAIWRYRTWSRRGQHLGEFIWLAGSTVLLFRMGRMAPVFAIIAAPMLAATFPRLPERWLGRPGVLAVLSAILVTGAWRVAGKFPAHSVPMSTWLNRRSPADTFPGKAADFVDQRVEPVTGRLICEMAWGGYLEWRLGNHYQVMMDGRTQLFSGDFWRQTYLGTTQDRQRLLSVTTADAAVVPSRGSIFLPGLMNLKWRVIYVDHDAAVLVPPGAVLRP